MQSQYDGFLSIKNETPAEERRRLPLAREPVTLAGPAGGSGHRATPARHRLSSLVRILRHSRRGTRGVVGRAAAARSVPVSSPTLPHLL